MANENWQAVVYSGPYDAARVWSDKGQIALVNSQDGRAHEHYARLMAAAPDLLEALEMAEPRLQISNIDGTEDEPLQAIAAAISKAKGV
jgi:hypothetical protein